MSTGLHKDLDIAELHRVQSLTFADDTERNAFAATPADVGRVCQVLSTLSFYILKDDSPLTWSSMGVAGGQTNSVAGSNGITNTGDNIDAVLTPTYGSSPNTICQGNDSRLSDARTPTAHATSHQSGGSDAIKLDDLAAPDDNTDLDASTTKHGLLKKLDGSTEKYLRGDGAWTTFPVFGKDYQRQEVVARATTTGENSVRVTLTTGALTGTYRIGFGCAIDCNNKITVETLYNSTDAAVLWKGRPKPPTVNDVDFPLAGAVELVLTGTSKTLQLRYGNAPGQNDEIGIQYAYIEMWRVS